MIMGDLNGKTSVAPDFVNDETDNHSPITHILTYAPDTPLKRNNLGNKKVDEQGNSILEICKNFNVRILNGRTAGDRWGVPTRFPLDRKEKASLIDYSICSSKFLPQIRSFFVLPYNELSDHCCISTCIKVQNKPKNDNTIKEAIVSTPPRPTFELKLVERYHNNLLMDAYKFQQLQEEMASRTNPQTEPTQNNVDNWVERFNNLIVSNAKKYFPPKAPRITGHKPKPYKSAKWFNGECLRTKKSYK